MTVAADWTKHRPLARLIAREYRVPGAELQDVEQEALIGLWVAARTYDGSGKFTGWANIVIRRRLNTVLTSALTNKNRILRDADRDGLVLLTDGIDPERVAIDRERLARITAALGSLTARERQAVADHLNGAPSKLTRSHDSSLTRARTKLRQAAA